MDPYIQMALIGLVFGAATLGVHWAFMRDYDRDKKRQDKAQ